MLPGNTIGSCASRRILSMLSMLGQHNGARPSRGSSFQMAKPLEIFKNRRLQVRSCGRVPGWACLDRINKMARMGDSSSCKSCSELCQKIPFLCVFASESNSPIILSFAIA